MKLISRLALKTEQILFWYFSLTAKRRRNRKETNQVLIARTDGLGDYIIWLSVGEEIRRLYPGKKLVMLLDDTKPTCELSEMNCCVDEFINIGIHGRKRFLSIWKAMRMSYDIILQPVYSRLAFTDLLLFAMRAGKRITIDTNGQLMTKWEWRISNRGYDEIICCSGEVHHELIRCAEFIRGLGNAEFRAAYPKMAYGKYSGCSGSYIAVFPSASWIGKVWEKEKFAQLLQWMLDAVPHDILLCGDVRDDEVCSCLKELVPNDRIVNMAGKTSLPDTVCLIGNAEYVFGNDTGALHIAAACNRPFAVILADREFGRFFPYETEQEEEHFVGTVVAADMPCRQCLIHGMKECVYHTDPLAALPCIEEISVEMVKQKLMEDKNWTALTSRQICNT